MEKDKAHQEAEGVNPQHSKDPHEGSQNSNLPESSDKEKAVSNDQGEPEVSEEGKAINTENDLSENDHEDENEAIEEEENVDYSEFSKKQLVELIKNLAKSDNVIKAEHNSREIKPYYDEFFEKEKKDALEKFLAEGGLEEDFSYKYDELDNLFEANFKLIRDRKHDFQKNQDQRKDENLKRKEAILERLREFVDSDESNFSFDTFKVIQEEWKGIGSVPQAQARTLWANYNALVDRFYDNRSIYFELKELDRKKNLTAKLMLCEKAEKLVENDNIKEAIKELNELHHDFKHVGPVPKEEQENVWQRFKAASDAVYARRKGYVDELKEELTKNEEVKRKLANQVQAYTSFESDRIKEWNEKTKELLEIQKQWEATGGVPRNHAKEINKKFWNAFKKFFQHKSAFFKHLDSQREENLVKKQELVKQALELKENTNWNETAEKLKNLQRQWKDIGPVPEKVRDQVYNQFKEACDFFFNKKRASSNDSENEYYENLTAKEDILNNIDKLAEAGEQDVEKLRDFQGQYDELGFVPKRDITRIKDRYTEVVDKFIAQLQELDDDEKQKLKLESQIIKMKQGPNADHKLHKKEQTIRKQISKVENEISTYKNNMEFFASSKKADKLKDEFTSKIEEAKEQLQLLKQQLKIIRNA